MSSRGAEAKIIIMGPTGSGKSQFVNCASGSSDLPVGRTLESCTSAVTLSRPFFLNGRIVTMVDTPGFDDTNRSDADVLSSIAAYLSKSYEGGVRLAGIIYLHRITDVRMGGTSKSTFRIFRELCGDSTFKNVFIVTNMWENVNHELGEAREKELATNPQFFKLALDRGARMLRHNGTHDSALAILRHLVENKTAALAIQQEIVDEGKVLADTAAGAELSRAMTEQVIRHDKELTMLRAELEAAMHAKDEETRQEMQEEIENKREDVARINKEVQRMKQDFAAEKAQLEERMEEMEKNNHGYVERLQEMQGLVNQVMLQTMRSQTGTGRWREEEAHQARILAEERLANAMAKEKHEKELQKIQEDTDARIRALQEEIAALKVDKATAEEQRTKAEPGQAEAEFKWDARTGEADQRAREKQAEQERLNRLIHLAFTVVTFVMTRFAKGSAEGNTPKMC